MYSEKSRQMARRIAERTGTDKEKTYTMMLLTAVLLDLNPDDGEIEERIMKDWEAREARERACGYTQTQTHAEAKSPTAL